jgi:predicted enzyme related to lactoylglutathione lyase
MPAEVLFSGVPTASLGSARPWYEALFGRPADVIVNEHEVMWHVCDGGWMYVVENESAAGHALVAVAVSDLDQIVDAIVERGIGRPAVETIPGVGRKAPVVDPEGNVVTFIEVDETGS